MANQELIFDPATHRYTVGGKVIPSVTQIISAVGLYDLDFISRETLRISAERGTIVHTYVEWFEAGTLDPESIDPELKGYFLAYLRAKASGKLPQERPALSEHRVYSARYGYAGTLDQLFGNEWINDIKSGVKGREHGLQLSAYWLALHPDLNDKPRRLTCTYLSRDGVCEVVDYPYEPLPWLAILADYKWRAANNKIKEIWK